MSFRQILRDVILASPEADELFPRITGYKGVNNDVSFVATLRAALPKRMSEDDELHHIYYTYNDTSNPPTAKARAKEYIDGILRIKPEEFTKGTFCVLDFNIHNDESRKKIMDFVEKNFLDCYPGWERTTKPEEFFSHTFRTLCFTNPETKCTIIFCEYLDIRRYHYLQCAIPVMLPWYYATNKATQDEIDFFKTLFDYPDSSAYLQKIKEIASGYDFRTARVRRLLKDFETKYERQRAQLVENNIADYDRSIERYKNSIADTLRERHRLEIELLGLKCIIHDNGENSEIMDYFISNTSVNLKNCGDDDLTFVATDYVSYYDEDELIELLENSCSTIYEPEDISTDEWLPTEDVEAFFRAVFIDQKLKIKFCAAYTIYLHGSVEGIKGYDYDYNDECLGCMPNPHIDYYRCLGSHECEIITFLQNRDYIGAIEQCIASAKSLNFTDITVINRFIGNLYGRNGEHKARCVELPDGNILTMKEAIKWLKEQA